MKILGIDPELNKPAYSIFVDGEPVAYGFIERRKKNGKVDFPKYQQDLIRLIEQCDEVAVEGQFSGKNKKTYADLVAVRQEVFYQSMVLGKHCEVISPVSWQSKILRCKPSDVREKRKQASILIASALCKKKIVNHNLADAINIAKFYDSKSSLLRKYPSLIR